MLLRKSQSSLEEKSSFTERFFSSKLKSSKKKESLKDKGSDKIQQPNATINFISGQTNI